MALGRFTPAPRTTSSVPSVSATKLAGAGGHVLGTADVDLVGLVADREALLIAAVDAVLDCLPPHAAGLPAQHPLTVVSRDGFQANVRRRHRTAGREAPRLAPRAPDALVVLGPDAPPVLLAGRQQADIGQAVPRLDRGSPCCSSASRSWRTAARPCRHGRTTRSDSPRPVPRGDRGTCHWKTMSVPSVVPPSSGNSGPGGAAGGMDSDRSTHSWMMRTLRAPADLVAVGELVLADGHAGQGERGHLQIVEDAEALEPRSRRQLALEPVFVAGVALVREMEQGFQAVVHLDATRCHPRRRRTSLRFPRRRACRRRTDTDSASSRRSRRSSRPRAPVRRPRP